MILIRETRKKEINKNITQTKIRNLIVLKLLYTKQSNSTHNSLIFVCKRKVKIGMLFGVYLFNYVKTAGIDVSVLISQSRKQHTRIIRMWNGEKEEEKIMSK